MVVWTLNFSKLLCDFMPPVCGTLKKLMFYFLCVEGGVWETLKISNFIFLCVSGTLKKNIKKLKEANTLLNVETKEEDYTEIRIEESTPSERSIILSKYLDSISESCRKVLELFYYRNLTVEEIVQVTEYKDGNTVRSHKSRCLKRLKSLFKKV